MTIERNITSAGNRARTAQAAACWMALIMFLVNAGSVWGARPVPEPKVNRLQEEAIELQSVQITWMPTKGGDDRGKNFREIFEKHGIPNSPEGTIISLTLDDIGEVKTESRYSDSIKQQAYRIEIQPEGIRITAASEQALFYASQTLDQLIENKQVPLGTIIDWPDLPMRMLMIDPARQNENQNYYKDVIKFAGRYKINYILCHLTDDQTSALYHENYPEIMHGHAWREAEITDLRELAASHYIQLIPEIESLGHSRLFTRMKDYENYLHMTDENDPDESWMGTNIPGFTNVLCPSSDDALEYLDAMYSTAGKSFPHEWLHIGFDEVDMTRCKRCIAKFGEQTEDAWMTTALQQVNKLVKEHGKKSVLWGDMLLSHPEVMDKIDPEDYIIFDWYYRDDVTADSVKEFTRRGFEVVASPALVCAPHMVMPDVHNYLNIEKFSEIARENDLLGVNTTIWVPTRYMSDVLWTGIAYASAHAWGGSNFDEAAFFEYFMQDYFGSKKGAEYREIWSEASAIIWHRVDFNAACWIDEESLTNAANISQEKRTEIEEFIVTLSTLRSGMDEIAPTITKNSDDWKTIERSLEIIQYSMEHLLAASRVAEGDRDVIKGVADHCNELTAYIIAEWDENRFVDDPGKEGEYLKIQHLLFRFKQMQRYHAELLDD